MYAFTGPKDSSQSVLRSSLRASSTTLTPPTITQAPDVSAEKAATLSAIADGCGDFEVSGLLFYFHMTTIFYSILKMKLLASRHCDGHFARLSCAGWYHTGIFASIRNVQCCVGELSH